MIWKLERPFRVVCHPWQSDHAASLLGEFGGSPHVESISITEIEQLAHIFTTLLPNSVGVGLKPSARLNSSV